MQDQNCGQCHPKLLMQLFISIDKVRRESNINTTSNTGIIECPDVEHCVLS
jgi:hypothetical protein